MSHTIGLNETTDVVFFFKPFEKTVIVPVLFLPALFLIKNLKIFLKFLNFNKNVVFLNLCVDVVGLHILVKI